MWVMISGVVSMILLIIAMLPPLRLTIFERFIGLPDFFRVHHICGIFSVVAGIAHVILVVKPFFILASTPLQAVSLLLETIDTMMTAGVAALSMILMVVLTSYWPPMKRRTWIRFHRVSILAFLLTMLHVVMAWIVGGHFFSLGHIATMIVFSLVFLGLMVHLVRPEFLAAHSKFIVEGIRSIRPGLIELVLKLDRDERRWRSGEFAYFRFDCEGPCGVSRESHPFTIVQIPNPKELRIVVKEAGDDTGRLQQIVLGTSGEIAGPYGGFRTLFLDRRPQLWIAGGLGLMPFLGLAYRLSERKYSKTSVVLLWFRRSKDDPYFVDELTKISEEQSVFRVFFVDDPGDRKANIEDVVALVPDWRERIIALAGPHGMIEYWSEIFRSLGIPQSKIVTEGFAK